MGLQPPTLYGGLPTSIPQRQDAPREKNEEEKKMTNTTCLNVAREYKRLKAELADMTAQCNEMRQEIMTYMTRAGKTRVASEDITVVLAHRSRSQLDAKAMRADHPDIVRNYEYVTEYDELKIL